MHITGEKGGTPVKVGFFAWCGETAEGQVGVAVTDILTGHFAQSGILAALLKRAKTGKGSRVECSLFESQASGLTWSERCRLTGQIASLVNIGSNYLIGGQEATRWGTAHPSIVPYQVFPTKDSFIMLSAGNDSQFATLASAQVLNRPQWTTDQRFATNAVRVANREEMIHEIEKVLQEHTTAEWVEKLTGKG